MSRKTIVIVLLVLVGGVAAYNLKFFVERAKKKEKPKVAETSEKEAEPAKTDAPPVASAPEPAAAPAPEGQRNAAGTSNEQAERAQTTVQENDAHTERASNLPAIFTMEWVNPMQPAVVATTSSSETAPGAMGWSNTFENTSPVVSAVLIGRKGRRAIINGHIVNKGDRLPGTDAVVCEIHAEGVEIKAGGTTRYFPVGRGSTTGSKTGGGRRRAPAGRPSSSKNTVTSTGR